MQNDVKQPLPQPSAVEEQAADGYIPNGEPAGFTGTVLSLLESVLALL